MFLYPSSLWEVINIFIFLQGAITQLSEQILTLNDRMEEFTSRIEELNSKLNTKEVYGSQQNIAQHHAAEACNGSAPTSYFLSNLGNGSLLPNSSSSSQLAKEFPLMEEVHWLLPSSLINSD